MECRGQERDSLYCPNCGSPIVGETPLGGLLLHPRTARRFADANTTVGDEHDPEHAREYADKWRSWIDAVRAVIQQQTEGS